MGVETGNTETQLLWIHCTLTVSLTVASPGAITGPFEKHAHLRGQIDPSGVLRGEIGTSQARKLKEGLYPVTLKHYLSP